MKWTLIIPKPPSSSDKSTSVPMADDLTLKNDSFQENNRHHVNILKTRQQDGEAFYILRRGV